MQKKEYMKNERIQYERKRKRGKHRHINKTKKKKKLKNKKNCKINNARGNTENKYVNI